MSLASNGTIFRARSTERFGWVSQPSDRGTVDIIWSCVSTLLVCVYAMLHLNVPARTDGWWRLFFRKCWWLFLAIAAPELVMLFAGSQWDSAHRSVASMNAIGMTDWSLTHAFYADSGGFVLEPPDSVSFPITAKHLEYLVNRAYVAVPKITREEILDKSKADVFAKVVAGVQSIWFIGQCLARVITGLPLTLLELATLGIISCTSLVFYFWMHKPLNVSVPTILRSKAPIATILVEAGDTAKKPFMDTPLDFVEGQLSAISHCGEPCLEKLGIRKRPLPRLPNNRDTRLTSLRPHLLLALATIVYSVVHLAGWNASLPTRAEQITWRWSCVVMTIVLGSYGIIEVVGAVRDGFSTSGLSSINGYKLKWPHKLLFLVPGAIYFTSRICIIGEIIVSLRSLPSGCFVDTNWSNIIPHL